MAAPNTTLADDPKKIADELVQDHGVDKAIKIAGRSMPMPDRVMETDLMDAQSW